MMNTDAIRYLAKKFAELQPQQQLGKTALVKLLYFAQEVEEADLGYEFGLYTFGPFDNDILYELDRLKYEGEIEVKDHPSGWGYLIEPTQTIEKTKLDKATREKIDAAIEKYGDLTARKLEIRATLHFIHVHSETKVKGRELYQRVQAVKPHYKILEIKREARLMNPKL